MASSLAHEGCSKPDLQHDLTFLILTSLQVAATPTATPTLLKKMGDDSFDRIAALHNVGYRHAVAGPGQLADLGQWHGGGLAHWRRTSAPCGALSVPIHV
jgi:hypothetical protein